MANPLREVVAYRWWLIGAHRHLGTGQLSTPRFSKHAKVRKISTIDPAWDCVQCMNEVAFRH